jgi:hypothetical protein
MYCVESLKSGAAPNAKNPDMPTVCIWPTTAGISALSLIAATRSKSGVSGALPLASIAVSAMQLA